MELTARIVEWNQSRGYGFVDSIPGECFFTFGILRDDSGRRLGMLYASEWERMHVDGNAR